MCQSRKENTAPPAKVGLFAVQVVSYSYETDLTATVFRLWCYSSGFAEHHQQTRVTIKQQHHSAFVVGEKHPTTAIQEIQKENTWIKNNSTHSLNTIGKLK